MSACSEWPMSRQAKTAVANHGGRLYRIIFPSFCCACKAVLPVSKALCESCAHTIKPLASKVLEITPKYSMRVFCVGAYENPLRQFVLAKSYSDHLACYYIARLIYERSLFSKLDIDYIVAIPLHWQRYAKRGYNQSEEIAKWLSKLSGIPFKHVLRRKKATAFQSHCDKDGRFENVKNAFEFAISASERIELHDKRILIVDDVMTTGATLIAAGKVLAALRPAHLFACVLAR
jgi:ComF family protein